MSPYGPRIQRRLLYGSNGGVRSNKLALVYGKGFDATPSQQLQNEKHHQQKNLPQTPGIDPPERTGWLDRCRGKVSTSTPALGGPHGSSRRHYHVGRNRDYGKGVDTSPPEGGGGRGPGVPVVFRAFWSFVLGSRPAFLAVRVQFRICVRVPMFLSAETSPYCHTAKPF